MDIVKAVVRFTNQYRAIDDIAPPSEVYYVLQDLLLVADTIPRRHYLLPLQDVTRQSQKMTLCTVANI